MRNGTTAFTLLLGALVFGCGKGQECEKARLEASKAWQTVMQQAGENELKGPPGFDELTEPQKAEHVKQWRDMKTQAELVSSSFTYEKITWKTADPAHQQLNTLFNGYSAKTDFPLFAASIKTGNGKFDTAGKLCRD